MGRFGPALVIKQEVINHIAGVVSRMRHDYKDSFAIAEEIIKEVELNTDVLFPQTTKYNALCPVCEGTGEKQKSFYAHHMPVLAVSIRFGSRREFTDEEIADYRDYMSHVQCRSCKGKGYV